MLRPFSVAEYRRLHETGVLSENDKVELIHGWVVNKMGQNTPHRIAIPLAQIALQGALPPGWYLAVQQPVGASDSEPEPDFSVVRGTPRDYPDGTPRPPNVGMLAEVSDTSLDFDRDAKGPLYARENYPIYWVINLPERRVEVYTDPSGLADQPGYRRRQDYGINDAVPVVLDGVEVARIPVRDLLP
jgi:Uma2 family endonuclease